MHYVKLTMSLLWHRWWTEGLNRHMCIPKRLAVTSGQGMGTSLKTPLDYIWGYKKCIPQE